jgi:hypothetical protein
MKLIKKDVVSGTEDETTEVKDFKKKFQEYKEKYIKDNTLESMVYENGSALALLYKEVSRLNQLLTANLQTDEQKN